MCTCTPAPAPSLLIVDPQHRAPAPARCPPAAPQGTPPSAWGPAAAAPLPIHRPIPRAAPVSVAACLRACPTRMPQRAGPLHARPRRPAGCRTPRLPPASPPLLAAFVNTLRSFNPASTPPGAPPRPARRPRRPATRAPARAARRRPNPWAAIFPHTTPAAPARPHCKLRETDVCFGGEADPLRSAVNQPYAAKRDSRAASGGGPFKLDSRRARAFRGRGADPPAHLTRPPAHPAFKPQRTAPQHPRTHPLSPRPPLPAAPLRTRARPPLRAAPRSAPWPRCHC
jgi:hypothetical protein